MADGNGINSKEVKQFGKGLHTDNSPQAQPEGTLRFALNCVDETEVGDMMFPTNLESNIEAGAFPNGYIPIGKVFIGNGETAIFLVGPNDTSEIGIYKDTGEYVTYVNDALQETKLGFRITNQIDAIYRLRRGCDYTIYWTDNLNPVRHFVFNKLEDYQRLNTQGQKEWNISSFSLFKRWEKIPKFEKINVLEAGSLKAGSYNVAIQYLDSDLNPTEWIIASDTINIYHDSLYRAYREIRGSSNIKNSYQDWGESTGKAIEVNLSDLDTNFTFYRLGLIEATNGTGLVNKITASEPMSTKIVKYIFDSNNGETITIEEISQFTNIISTAQSIEQIENRLLLGNVKGKRVNFCDLQRYASKIISRYVVEKVILNQIAETEASIKEGESIQESSSKDPLVNLKKVGYMPGEIYSFGIVYYFKDGSYSPVYHIPGKSPLDSTNVSNMASDNIMESIYTDSSNCDDGDYWGKDYLNNNLNGTHIRHHRFPTRSEAINPTTGLPGIGFVKEETITIGTSTKTFYTANILGIKFSNITVPSFTGDNEIIGYKIVRNERDEENKTILDSGILFPISEYENFLSYSHSIPNLSDVVRAVDFNLRTDKYAFVNPEFLFNKREYSQNNIEFINGGEFTKLDYGVIPTTNGRKVIAGDRLIENFIEDTYPGTSYDPAYHKGSEKDSDGLTLHTVTRFRDTEFKEQSSFGASLFTSNIRSIFYLDSLSSKSVSADNRNIDIFNVSSDNRVGIIELEGNSTSPFTIDNPGRMITIPKIITRSIVGSRENVTDFADILLIDSELQDQVNPSQDFLSVHMETLRGTPYFYMKRPLLDPYNNFRYLPYYSEQDNVRPISNTSTENIFNGDAYISPLTFNNSFFHDIKLKKRKTKSQTWKFIAGGLMILGGLVGAVFTGGGSLTLVGVGVGLMGAAAGISFISSGIKGENVNRIYEEKYEEGLRVTVQDSTARTLFINNSPTNPVKMVDDEIQWYNEVINGIWFESQVNIGLRQGNTVGLPDFIPAPFDFMTPKKNVYENETFLGWNASNPYFRRRAIEKLSVLDPESGGGRLYQGYSTAEYYEVNKDFMRREREKPFFHLGLEYDCCSDCIETFPHRIHYSEQSFQEENVDNYRVFLPNNYRDINGETGEITNIFRIQNNLFVHTEEAIWKLPKNYQERVTDEVVSFIGTGSYFSIPPQKLVDDETGNSYGTNLKWSRLRTPYGYFFVSDSQNTIFQFDGNQIKDISKLGNYYWFYNHIPILSNTLYKDNPSNPNGAGFISVYDSKKDLIFFTKKDKLPTGEDNSWTISFNLKKNTWGSWHSFMPNFYIQTTQWYFSWINGNNSIWRHNVLGNYQTYYGELKPFIIEYVLTDNILSNKLFDAITLQLESKKYDPISKTFYDIDRNFFNQLIAYNSRQCTGVLNIIVKDKESPDFIFNQVQNTNLQNIIADRNERNWSLNELRDMVSVKNAPMFISDIKELQDEYFIDKKLNNAIIDFNKDWTQIESFRDKYLVVRFIFNKFADIKLITNFTINDETISLR